MSYENINVIILKFYYILNNQIFSVNVLLLRIKKTYRFNKFLE